MNSKLKPFRPISVFDSTFYRHFEDIFDLFDDSNYPPMNVIKVPSPDHSEPLHYYVEFAVSGFTKDDLTIKVNGSTITVSGHLKADSVNSEDGDNYVKRQIAKRAFTKQFSIGRTPVQVENAMCKDGLLSFEIHYVKPPEGETVIIA